MAHHGAPGLSRISLWYFPSFGLDAPGNGASDPIWPYNHERWIKDFKALTYL